MKTCSNIGRVSSAQQRLCFNQNAPFLASQWTFIDVECQMLLSSVSINGFSQFTPANPKMFMSAGKPGEPH